MTMPAPKPEQVIAKVWLCTGVEGRTLIRKSEQPHTMPIGRTPSQPTTDLSGKWMQGRCPTCKAHTIWKEVIL